MFSIFFFSILFAFYFFFITFYFIFCSRLIRFVFYVVSGIYHNIPQFYYARLRMGRGYRSIIYLKHIFFFEIFCIEQFLYQVPTTHSHFCLKLENKIFIITNFVLMKSVSTKKNLDIQICGTN